MERLKKRREGRDKNKSEDRKRKVKISFEFSQKQHPSIVAVDSNCLITIWHDSYTKRRYPTPLINQIQLMRSVFN
jgi:hypothetical protein